MILPFHESDKSLADQFAYFVLNKIKTIRDTFVPCGTENDDHPPSVPPNITALTQVSEDAVDKIIGNSPIKYCLLEPWPTFLIKECRNILLPSISKLVNCSVILANSVTPNYYYASIHFHLYVNYDSYTSAF